MYGLLLGGAVVFFLPSNVCPTLQLLFPSLVLAYGPIFGQSLLPQDLKQTKLEGESEVCLQTARALPFKQEVMPGASPSALEGTLIRLPEELLKGKPSLHSNLIAGVPLPEILARCEFLNPLSEATLSDYEGLVANLQKPAPVLIKRMQLYMSSLIQRFLAKATLKR